MGSEMCIRDRDPSDAPLFGHTGPRSRSARTSLSPAAPVLMEPSTSPEPPVPQVREPGGDEADGSDEVDVVNAYADVSGGNTTVAPGDDTVIEHEPRGDLLLPTAPSCASISLDGSEGDERDGQSSPGDPSRPASAALDEDQKQQRILSAMELSLIHI